MKLKILVGINLFFFFAVVVSIITAGFVYREIKKGNLFGPNSMINGNGSVSATGQVSGDNSEKLTLTVEEIAKHNSSGDCWLIIENKVYNATGFLSSHPGGESLIIPYCGMDATKAFGTKDKVPSVDHTQFAKGLLNNYYIGNVGEALENIPVDVTTSVSTNLPTVQNPVGSGVILTSGEVASHNTLLDCWIIVSGNVYNVTRYIVSHPGGSGVIINTCGSDATKAFQTRGGKGSNHSQTAYNLLSKYLIGSVGSSVTVNAPVSQDTNLSGNIPTSVNIKYPGAVILNQSTEDDGRIEMKLNYNGSCIKIKLNTSGQISEEEKC